MPLPRTNSSTGRARFPSALASLLALLAGCGSGRDAGPAAKPNVILVTLDTLRADHLGCYGYERPTSPRLDAFAASATLYPSALATAPWTIPTHASLFTGKPPFAHGAHTIRVPRADAGAEPGPGATSVAVRPLDESHLTLAEALQREGYATAAFVGNWGYLAPRFRLDQGFDTYFTEKLRADELFARALPWIEAHRDGPFFLFLNTIDTHRPYDTTPRPGFLARPAPRDQGMRLDRLRERVLPGTDPLPRGLVRNVIDQYDTAIANLDERLGALFDRLRELELYDPTMIVVTSDHGEFFGEHHLVEHSKDVYQEVLRVPLIVKAPFQEVGERRDVVVSSTDVPGLILAQCPPELAERYAADFPDTPGDHLVISENYFSRAEDLADPRWRHRFDRIRTAVFDWPYKLVLSSDGQDELYHLVDDPTESENLFAVQMDVARRLKRSLERARAERGRWEGDVPVAPLTEDERRRLESLGYAGGD